MGDAWTDRQLDALTSLAALAAPRAAPSLLDVIGRVAAAAAAAASGMSAEPTLWDDVDDACLDHWCRRIDGWRDCADFDLLRVLTLLLGAPELVPAHVRDRLVDRVVSFGYWYTDPRTAGVVDHRWYWSENHRLIFAACELVAGHHFAEATFTRTGQPGAWHAERAERALHAWFDEKAQLGFSEWHSDTYYGKDLAALLTLVELGPPGRVRDRATAFLDLLLLDLALHQLGGNAGATHGRSYMRHKARAATQPIAGALRLCFGSTDPASGAPVAWALGDDDDTDLLPLEEATVLLARARRYRPPAVLAAVANDPGPFVDHETMGIDIEVEGPVGAPAVRADRRRYDDPDLVPFWWDRGALTPWPVIPLLLDTLGRYDLWGADLMATFRTFRGLLGDDPAAWQDVSASLHRLVNAGLLTRVTTTTWRSRHAMLSTAQRYRPGCVGFQHHVSQATLGHDAVVFVTHAGNGPTGARGDYLDDDRYWTGSATLPLAVQRGRVSISVFAPGFASPAAGDALGAFAYEPETHAWFPTERFDEVTERNGWVLGRRGDGYVAVWSWRPTAWRRHEPSVSASFGLSAPFDLVAAGGADDVWITEVGDVETAGSFASFCDAVASAPVAVHDHGWDPDGHHRGFDVRYRSPAEGHLELRADGTFACDGRPADPPEARFDNPFCRVEPGSTTVEVRAGGEELVIDLDAGRVIPPTG